MYLYQFLDFQKKFNNYYYLVIYEKDWNFYNQRDCCRENGWHILFY